MFGKRLYLKACAGLALIAFLFLLSGCAAVEYEVKTEVEPEGSGEVAGGGTYSKGETVTVKAEPADGYEFEKWKKNGEPLEDKNQEIELEVEQNLDLVAGFAQKTYEVNLESSPGGSNFLAALEGSGTYQHGGEVEIEAEEIAYGFRFKKWVEDEEKVSGDKNYRFTIEEDRELKAVREFDLNSLIQIDDLEGYLLPVEEGEAVGLINQEGETAVKPNIYLNKGLFYDRYGVRPVKVNKNNPLVLRLEVDDDRKTLIINQKAELIGDPLPGYKGKIHNDHGTIVYDGNKFGFKDHDGNQILENRYDDLEVINGNGLLKVNEGGSKGIAASEDGEMIIGPRYDGLEVRQWLEHGIYKVIKNGNSYLLDKSGEKIRELNFDVIEPPAGPEGLIKVKQDNLWGLVNISGELLVEPDFKWIMVPAEPISPDHAVASYRKNSVIGFFDAEGEVIAELPENETHIGYGDYILFSEDGKTGLKTIEGDLVEEAVYEDYNRPGHPGVCGPGAEVIVEHYAYFKKGGLWAVFDFNDGQFVTDFKFADILSYREALGGNRPFEFNGVVQMIANEEGHSRAGLYSLDLGQYIISPDRYDHVAPLKYNRSMVVEDGKYGYVDENGIEVIEPQYDQAVSFSHEAAAVLKGEKLKIIDKEGNQIVEPIKIDLQDFEDRPFPYNNLTLKYLEGPDVYVCIDNSYLDQDGWIKKP